jgi:hypothetical protein
MAILNFTHTETAILWESLEPASTSTSTVDGTSILAVNMLPVQTFMDEPCLGTQVQSPNPCLQQIGLQTKCTTFIYVLDDLWKK